MLKLPKHIMLAIEHNQQNLGYQTVAEELASMPGFHEFQTEEARQRAIDTNELWTCQWYPETPAGFCVACAPTLTELLEWLSSFE